MRCASRLHEVAPGFPGQPCYAVACPRFLDPPATPPTPAFLPARSPSDRCPGAGRPPLRRPGSPRSRWSSRSPRRSCPAPGAGTPAATSGSPSRRARIFSSLDEYERKGFTFTDGGAPEDVLAIVQRHGVDTVRLRVWVDPAGGWCGTERTLAMAARIHARGLRLLLDLHYSDTWADPAHQPTPAAWAGLTDAALRERVRAYTAEVVAALRAQGTPPDLVQLGNEITCGLLWDQGRVCDAFDTDAQWDRLAGLLLAAADGVSDGLDGGRVPLLLHTDRGGDADGATRLLDRLVARGVRFDAVALSFYPWWHGGLPKLAHTLEVVSSRYGRDVLVVETAYPWTLTNFGGGDNFVWEVPQLQAGYPATPQGQRDWLAAVLAVVRATPGGHGKGVVAWGPELSYAPGMSQANPVDNLALFDDQRRALPGLSAFE
ncbi:MAG: glycosyl hydrolase 53 family protein [Anaeromyxobacter sp.]